MAKKNLKKLRYAWGGFDMHPFLVHVDRFFQSEGFVSKGFEYDCFSFEWERTLFRGYSCEISALPSYPLPDGKFGFHVTIFVISDRQRVVETITKPWECGGYSPGYVPDLRRAVAVFGAGLRWLRAYWPPRIPIEEVREIEWYSLPNALADVAAEEVIEAFQHQGKDFIEYIGSPQRLANTLRDIHKFPGREGKGASSAPFSADASQYAAVLLHDLGKTEEALAELECERRILAAEVERDPRQRERYQILLRYHERLKQWMQSETVQFHV